MAINKEPLAMPRPLTLEEQEVQVLTGGVGTKGLGVGRNGGSEEQDEQSEPNPGKYDPAKFIIPGQDAQGHSERIFCRVPPPVLRQVEVVVRSRRFPFRTNGDIYRWALWTGLKMLDKMEPVPNTFLCRAEAVQDILRDEIYQQEYMTTLEALHKVVDRHIAMGAVGEARRLVAVVKGQFQKIDEPHWRGKMLEELKGRFGHLLDTGRKATLNANAGQDGSEEGRDGKG